MKIISFILALLFSISAFSQDEKTPVNQVDSKGKRHGMWFLTIPARMGEPATKELGSYYHGNKSGAWYKFDHEGDLMSIESFRDNLLDGEAKYYERGILYCVGNYKALNPLQQFDTIVVMNPVTHEESYRPISTDRGTIRHGSWRFFNTHNGALIREEEYQADELVHKQEYTVSASSDSLYRKKYEELLPHKKGTRYTPPPGKRTSYLK